MIQGIFCGTEKARFSEGNWPLAADTFGRPLYWD